MYVNTTLFTLLHCYMFQYWYIVSRVNKILLVLLILDHC